MKTDKRETRVVARGMAPLVNGEAAQCGDAVLARNLRECEQSLQVTGEPAAAGAIAVGERLLLMTDGHTVTCRGTTVSIDGAVVATVSGAIVGAHAIGDVVVVASAGGLTYLRQHEGEWVLLDPADAVPSLTVGITTDTASADVPAYTFAEPYSQWQAPLADVDRTALTSSLRSAWAVLTADAAAEGCRLAPQLVRWALRLWDDTYLWMSEPVRVGDVTLANAERIAANVLTNSSGFIGTAPTTMTVTRYRLDLNVSGGVAAEWLPLVKSIDVFATDEAQLLASSRTMDYRCVTRTSSPREYVLEMGLTRRSAVAIDTQLAASPWRLVATAAASGRMSASDFTLPTEALTLTSAQCGAVGLLTSLDNVACTASAGGRLYCCTRGGHVVVSGAGNAFAAVHRLTVTGAVPRALSVVTRPLYSGGFGRYPVYLFTDDGIYAIPQSAAGTLGEARLVDRTVIAADVPPVEAGGDIWLISRHRHLCRLSGAKLTVQQRDVDCTALAWCDAYGELWLLPVTGYPMVLMASGRMSERTVDADQLYSDPRHAVAVTSSGTLLDLEREVPAVMPVSWRSHPVALHALMAWRLRRVVWHVSGQGTLTLAVIGQRGIMARESDLSVITVEGTMDHPLAAPVVLSPARTATLSVNGTATTGTLLLPTLLH